MSNIQTWGTFEEEALQQDDALAGRGGSSILKIGVGRNVLRFLPPMLGERTIFAIAHQHYVKLPGLADPVSFNCPHLHGVGVCPVCRKVDELRATGNAADYEMAGELRAKLRVFANVIDRAHPDLGPQTVAFGKGVYEALSAIRKDRDAGGDFTHPLTGFDIVITRKGSGKNDTEYDVKTARQSSPLHPSGDLTWLENPPNLKQYNRVPDPRALARQLDESGLADLLAIDVTRYAALPAGGRLCRAG